MKLSRILLLIVLFQCIVLSTNVVAQSNQDSKVVVGKRVYILHKVKKKETVYSIQRTYNIAASELYKANPKLKTEGLKSDSYIKIPIESKKQRKEKSFLLKNVQDNDSIRFHKVKKRETLFSIAQNYGISVKDIERANGLEEHNVLKKGDLLRIPLKPAKVEVSTPKKEEKKSSNYKYHIVKEGETLFYISRKYNIPFDDLKKENSKLGSHINVNDTIRIPLVVGATIDEITHKIVDTKFFHYRITDKDTYWKIEQKYGVTKSEILQLNPILSDELIHGVVIRLPYRRTTNQEVQILDNNNFYQYHVKAKETLYSIANKHGVTVRVLKELNPRLRVQNLMVGDEITIPNPEIARSFELGVNDSLLRASYLVDKISFLSSKDFIINPSSEVFNIGVMIPLYSEINKQLNEDLFSGKSNQHKIYSRTKNFLSFYEGIMVGIDSLNRKGLNVKLYLFDTEKKKHSIDSLYAKGVFNKLDLVIGPIYPTTQQALLQSFNNKQVPIVSPLSPQDKITNKYENIYQINPSLEYKVRKTAEYVIDSYANQNIIALKTNDKKLTDSFISPIRDALFKEHINQDSISHYTEFKLGVYGLEGLRFVLKKDKPNIILIPSRNEMVISQTLGQLNALTMDYDITVIGFNEWTKYRSIKEEILHNLDFHFLTPYHVNYNDKHTIQFIKRYKKYFYSEPNNFAFQGFDIALYFGDAMLKYGGNYTQMIYGNYIPLTQLDPNFVKTSKFGGFMNNSLFIMNYKKNFEIKEIGQMGHYRSIPIK